MMATKCLIFAVLLTVSDTQKRLVLHSDQDIDKVLGDMRQEISATKQENLALKTQMAQDKLALKTQMAQEIQALQNNMTLEKQALESQMLQENQALKNQMAQEIQALQNNMTLEKQALESQMLQENLALKTQMAREIQALQNNMTKEKQALESQMLQENLALKAQMAQDNQTLRAQMAQEIQALHTQMSVENSALNAKLVKLQKGQGSTYVRWGRTVCGGSGNEKVYSGFAAGSSYDSEGGAASNICLPQSPTWAQYIDGLQNIGGQVYGTEYETRTTFQQKAFGKDMAQQDAPCVVCHTPRSATIMIPGSTNCSAGWALEYTGYLMTGRYIHKAASDYACVDKNPEAIYHGEADTDGRLFFFTEVHCGTLPCQEYPQGRELACVVCSK